MAEPVTTEEKPAALPPELAALQAEAIALEGEQAAPAADGGTPGAAPTPPIDYLSDAKGLVDIAAETLAAFYPSTAPILTTEKRGRIAGALAPVLEKYGLDMAGIFGKWGAEIGLAFALAQVAIPLAKAIQSDRATDQQSLPPSKVVAGNPTVSAAAATPAADLHSRA